LEKNNHKPKIPYSLWINQEKEKVNVRKFGITDIIHRFNPS